MPVACVARRARGHILSLFNSHALALARLLALDTLVGSRLRSGLICSKTATRCTHQTSPPSRVEYGPHSFAHRSRTHPVEQSAGMSQSARIVAQQAHRIGAWAVASGNGGASRCLSFVTTAARCTPAYQEAAMTNTWEREEQALSVGTSRTTTRNSLDWCLQSRCVPNWVRRHIHCPRKLWATYLERSGERLPIWQKAGITMPAFCLSGSTILVRHSLVSD